jgi:hypothetical protein
MDGEYRVLQKISNDEPDLTTAKFVLSNRNARLFGGALFHHNTHVTYLCVWISADFTDMDACEALLAFVRQSQVLQKFVLMPATDNGRIDSGTADAFLAAAAGNASLGEVQFVACELPCGSFCSFLRQSSVAELKIYRCAILLQNQDSATELEGAVAENTTVKWTVQRLTGAGFLPILRGLKRQQKIRRLQLYEFDALECSGAIKELLESPNSSLKDLVLGDFNTLNEQSFGPIVTGCFSSSTLIGLALSSSFRDCFLDESATALFESMVQDKRSPRVLSLNFGSSRSKLRFSKPAGSMLANMLRHQGSRLSFLSVRAFCPGNKEEANGFLSAVKDTRIKKLWFANVSTSFCRQLVGVIPETRFLRKVKIGIQSGSVTAKLIDEAIQAFERNMSLEESAVVSYDNDNGITETVILNAVQDAKLKSYGRRNTGLWKIRESPRSNPVSFFPKTFKRAYECDTGPGMAFHCLLALDTLCCSNGGRGDNAAGRNELDVASRPRRSPVRAARKRKCGAA